jgi:hypothetical protein
MILPIIPPTILPLVEIKVNCMRKIGDVKNYILMKRTTDTY